MIKLNSITKAQQITRASRRRSRQRCWCRTRSVTTKRYERPKRRPAPRSS
jgi:hypothetical protein